MQIIFYLILGIRFRKELVMFSLRLELLTFARYFLVTGVCNTGISFSCWRLLLIYCMLRFISTTFSTQPQPLFVFLQYEAGSNNKRDKTKSWEGIIVSEIDKYIVSFFFDDKEIYSFLLLWWQRNNIVSFFFETYFTKLIFICLKVFLS